jgi:two-component system sensor histidine kinase KdpD
MSATLEQARPDAAELRQAVGRLTRTVDHLLDATRLESGLLQPVREWCDPVDLLREAIARAGLPDVAVNLSVGENLPTIFVDARLLEQALITLLSNASVHGGAQKIEASIARDQDALVFSVADDGPGLAPGEEAKVFEKFYRGAGRPTGGLGLGLSIARQLVEAQGGEIVARNRAGGGSRFSIRLPLGDEMRLPNEASG